MSDETRERYDLEAVYDEKISPLMAQIIAICKEHRMPVFASFAYADDGEDGLGYDFCTTSLHYDGRRPKEFLRADHHVRGSAGLIAMTITSGVK